MKKLINNNDFNFFLESIEKKSFFAMQSQDRIV